MADRDQFIGWIADRFQAAHVPPLSRERAIEYATGVLSDFEHDTAPFGHPDFDWGEDAAHVVADEDIQYWESVA